MRRITICAAGLLLAMTTVAGNLMAQHNTEIKVKQTISGMDKADSLDLNGDQEPGVLGFCGGTGTFGDYICNTVIDIAEFVPAGNLAACPTGTVYKVFFAAKGAHVQRFRNGDTLYWKPDPDPYNSWICGTAVPRFTVESAWEVVGGTGRFEGATGNLTMHITYDVLEVDNDGHGAVRGVSGTVDGTVRLPRP